MLCIKMCYIGVPTLKLIQAARTKEISTSRNRWIALEEGPTRIARLRLERKKREKANTISLRGGWNERIFTDRNYAKKRSQNQEI